MDEKTRIQKDITMFEENLQQIKDNDILNNKVVWTQPKYYLEKRDYFTAFGCINYAHGLLDSILKF